MTKKKSSRKSGSGPSNPEEYYAIMDGGSAKPENPDVYSLKKTPRTEPLIPGDEGEGKIFPVEAE